MIESHLPWWLGAAALAAAALLHWRSTGALLGVSGIFSSLLGSASRVEPGGAPWSARLLFVAMLAVDGLAGRLLMKGEWRPSLELGAEYASVFGSGGVGYLALAAGGVLVGAGTRLAGGCTSGHGLNRCARLQKPSLLNTTLFLGTAVAISLLVGRFA